MTWLSEMRVAIVLFLLAAVVPLAWARVDSARRLRLKQAAHAICASNTRHLEHCMHLHPGAELAPNAYELCRSGGSSHADCANWNPRGGHR